MGKKSLADMKEPVAVNMDWLETSIAFEKSGKQYSVPIKGHLVLKDINVLEIKDKLNNCSGKYAYWKALRVDVEVEYEALQGDYDVWFAQMYQIIDDETRDYKPKPTETKIKNAIILDNLKEYRAWQGKLREMSGLKRKIDVLVKSYEMQSWNLRSLGNLTQSELSILEVKGSGNLGDIVKRGAE